MFSNIQEYECVTCRTYHPLYFVCFQISTIEKEESVEFDMKWKVPCVLYYTRLDINSRYIFNISPNQINCDAFI